MFAVALVLSALAFGLLIVALRDLWRRRGRLPEVSYADRNIEQRTIAFFWTAVLVVGFVLGLSSGNRFISHAQMTSTPPEQTDPEMNSSSSISVSLPFLRYSIVESESTNGERIRVEEEVLQIPSLFLIALLFYWMAVVRVSGRSRERDGLGVRGA